MNYRILFFIRNLHGGGAQKIMIKLAAAASIFGNDVTIVTLNATGNFAKLVPEDVKIIELKSNRLITALFELPLVLRRQKPDLIFSTEVASNIITILSKKLSLIGGRTKLVIREALIPSVAMKSSAHSSIRLGYKFAHLFYSSADLVIAIAHGMKNDLINLCGVTESKIEVININPCVDDNLLRLKDEKSSHPWLDDKDVDCLLCVGRLAKQKGFEDAILTVVNINKRNQQKVRLLILGEGEERGYLQELIDSNDANSYISLYGECANPYAFMARCDLFIMPSRYEGLGNVLIEALACGARCIAYDCEVGPSETLNNGEFGRLVPLNNLEKLIEVVEEELKTKINTDLSEKHGRKYTSKNGYLHYDIAFKKLLKN